MVVVILILSTISIILLGILIRTLIALNGNVVDMHETFKKFMSKYEISEEANQKLRKMNFEVIHKISQGL